MFIRRTFLERLSVFISLSPISKVSLGSANVGMVILLTLYGLSDTHGTGREHGSSGGHKVEETVYLDKEGGREWREG